MSEQGSAEPTFGAGLPRPGSQHRWPAIGGGLLVLILLGLLLLPSRDAGRLVERGVLRLGERLVDSLAPDVPPARRAVLRDGVRCVAGEARRGNADPVKVGRFSRAARAALRDGSVNGEELAEVLALLMAACPHTGNLVP